MDQDKPRLLLLPHEDAVMCYAHIHQHLRSCAALSVTADTYTRAKPVATEWGRQVANAVTKDKGFTFHDHIGDGPKGGYMVSVDKDSETVVPLRNLHPDAIADYRDMHQQDLKDPNNFLGGWVYRGKVYLDVSRHVADRNQALALARQYKQLGIYDLSSGQTIMTPAEQAEAIEDAAQKAKQPPAQHQPLPRAAVHSHHDYLPALQRGAALTLSQIEKGA